MMKELDNIKQRLKEYHEHKNDPYAYYHEEIPQVGYVQHHAVEYLEFLITEIARLEAEKDEIHLLHGDCIVEKKNLLDTIKQLQSVVSAAKAVFEKKDLISLFENLVKLQQALRAVDKGV